jgi:hypothetical protein
MITISEDILWLIIPGAIVLLIILLILRLRGHIRRTVKNEIYDHFPTIRKTIEDFQRRVEFFKIEVDGLERKVKELKDQTANKQ